MSATPKLYIAGMGMITPVGFDTASTAASVRAGISGYRESTLLNKRVDPITIAAVPEEALPPLHEELEYTDGLTARQQRLLRLITPAISEVFESYQHDEPVPLFLAGPEALPGRPAPLGERFIGDVVLQTGANLQQAYSRQFLTGRAGGLQAVDTAFKYIGSTGHHFALVGGADTFIDLHWLRTLDNADRMMADGVRDGFVAGEAAGFLLLATEAGMARLGRQPAIQLTKPGLAPETGHRYSEQPYRGDGLSNAIKLAVAQGVNQPIRTIYASLNGEHFGAKEYSVASIRNKAAFDDAVVTEHPADCFGDIGAAFGPVLLGLAAMGIRQQYKPGPALVYCSSENQPRAAICISSR